MSARMRGAPRNPRATRGRETVSNTKMATLLVVALLGLGTLGGASVKANPGVPIVQSAPATAAAVPAGAPEPDVGAADTDNAQLQEDGHAGADPQM